MDLVKHAMLGVTALTSAIGISACGEDSFVGQANGICRDANTKTAALGQPSTPRQVPAFIDRELAIIQPAASRLRALTPPADKAQDYGSFLTDIDRQTAIARRLRALPANKFATRGRVLGQRAGQINRDGRTHAGRAGLKDCAK